MTIDIKALDAISKLYAYRAIFSNGPKDMKSMYCGNPNCCRYIVAYRLEELSFYYGKLFFCGYCGSYSIVVKDFKIECGTIVYYGNK